MHDPSTLAFKICFPWGHKSGNSFFWEEAIQIWHKDPCRDGTDDSCGWFMRSRHGDKKIYESIKKDFEFEWDPDYGGWFNKDGSPRLSPIGITLDMFRVAHWRMCKYKRSKQNAFMKNHLSEFLLFAENNIDSTFNGITLRYGPEKREDRIRNHASVIYGYILRLQRPWYKHPRWHFWHWEINVLPIRSLKRFLFSRCQGCRKGFPIGYSPITGQWNSDGPRWFKSEASIFHHECYPSNTNLAEDKKHHD